MKRSVYIHDEVETLIGKVVGEPTKFSGALNGLTSMGCIVLLHLKDCLSDNVPETCVNVSKAMPFLQSHEAVIIGSALHTIHNSQSE